MSRYIGSREIQEDSIKFQSKKSILKINTNCAVEHNPLKTRIDIKSKNWPVTVSWDSTKITDSCTIGSYFTRQHTPISDVMVYVDSFSTVEFAKQSSLTFKPSFVENEWKGYGYVTGKNDTISTFNFGFVDTTWKHWSSIKYEKKQNRILDYTFSNNMLTFNSMSLNMVSLKLYDINGRIINSYIENKSIDFIDLEEGVYFVNIKFENGTNQVMKIINKK